MYATRHEDLDRRKYPDVVWTRVTALDPATGDSRQIFSDEGSSLMLLFRQGMPAYPGEVIVAAGSRLFAHGVEGRKDRARGFSAPSVVYELSTDGSNTFRRVLDVRGDDGISELFVDAPVTHLGYLNYVGAARKRAAFTHEIATGGLLGTIDVDRLCSVCVVRAAGWLHQPRRLFFTLEPGPEGAYSPAEYKDVDKKVGTYFVDAGGGGAARLSAALVMRTLPKGFQGGARFVAPLPDGRYLLEYGGRWISGGEEMFLGVFHPAQGLEKRLPLAKQAAGVRWMKLSPGGRWLAITDTHGPRDQHQDLRIKDLESGEERVVASFPLKPYHLREDHVGLVGWLSSSR